MKTLSLLIFTLFFTISAIAQPWIEPTAGNIYYQGNVGIGTTNPGYKLDVIGEIYSSAGFRTTGSLGDDVNGSPWAGLGLSNLTFTGAIGTATQLAGYWGLLLKTSGGTMMMNSTGNIGIGTTNPNSKVVIAEGNNAMSISSGGIGFNRNVNDGQIFNSALSAWQLQTRDDRFTLEGYNGASPNLFTVLKNGNLGIGTISPAEKLEVSGNAKFTGISGVTDIWVGGAKMLTEDGTGNIKMGGVAGGSSLSIYSSSSEAIRILTSGNVGIGTTTPEAKLTVKGKIVASEIQVKDIGVIADYVFKPDYPLMSLDKVEDFVKQNQHLPEVPSEKEFKKDGMNVAEMNALLLKKVEELTLYAIDQNKRFMEQTTDQNRKLMEQAKKIEALEKAMNNSNPK